MARVTVEDCIDKVENRFELVLLASHRARMISAGAPITIDRDNDKNPVVALREIADETVSPRRPQGRPDPLAAEVRRSGRAGARGGADDRRRRDGATSRTTTRSPFDRMTEEELLRRPRGPGSAGARPRTTEVRSERASSDPARLVPAVSIGRAGLLLRQTGRAMIFCGPRLLPSSAGAHGSIGQEFGPA